MIAIDDLFREGKVKPVPVWLDGMIQEATAIHAAHPDYLTSSLKRSLLTDDGQNPFTSEWFRPVQGRELRGIHHHGHEPMHRLGHLWHDERRPRHGVLQALGLERGTPCALSATKPKAPSAAASRRALARCR